MKILIWPAVITLFIVCLTITLIKIFSPPSSSHSSARKAPPNLDSHMANVLKVISIGFQIFLPLLIFFNIFGGIYLVCHSRMVRERGEAGITSHLLKIQTRFTIRWSDCRINLICSFKSPISKEFIWIITDYFCICIQ